MRIDELIQTLVVNTDFAPVSPPALGPGYKATLAQIVSAGLYQPNSSTAGAGANLTIKAADGVTSGAGGSIYITAGSQASSGGHGSILLSSAEIRWTPLSTSSMYLRIWDEGMYSGVGIATSNMNDYYISFHGTAGRIVRFRANMEVYTGVVFNSNTAYSNASGLAYGYTGVTRVTDSGNGGGSFAYTSNTPTALSANTDNLSLNGSAFQRLSSSTAVNLTGIAGTSDAYRGVSHIDGRVIWLHNVGSFNITLKHSQTSTAANQFITETSGDLVLGPNRIVQCTYDGTSAKWRAHGETYPYVFPTADGTNGQVLVTNGSGTLSWSTNGNASASGTTNYVAKFTGTTSLGDGIIYDNGTHVGIGTTTLNQIGGSRTLSINSNLDAGIELNANNTVYGVVYANTNGLGLSGFGAFGMRFYTASAIAGSAERMRIDASGNVGIGTTSTTGKLTVANVGKQLTLKAYDGSQNNTVSFEAIRANYSDAASVLAIYTNSGSSENERVRIMHTGEVGIGTQTPGTKLEVTGTVRSAASSTAGVIEVGGDGGLTLTRDNSYDLTLAQSSSSSNGLYLSGAGNVYVCIDNNNNEADRKFIISNNAVKATNELFSVNESGNTYASGTLGVGTSSPGAQLQVSTAAATTKGLIVRGFTSQSANLQEWQNSAGTAIGYINSDMSLLVTPATFTLGSQSNNSGVVELYSGTVRLRPSSLGNYILTLTQRGVDVTGGVGDTTPVLKVTRNADANVGPVAQFVTGSTTHKGITVVGVASQTGNLQEWQNSSGTALAQIDAAGSATVVSLDISGPANLQMIRTKPNSVSYSRFLYSGSNENILYGGPTGLGVNNFADSVRLFNIADTGATSIALTSAAAKGLIVKGFTSQSANLQEWQNSSSNILGYVSATGSISSKFFEVKNQFVGQSGQPTITFTGAGNVPIALKVLDDSYGTLSFEGSAGQLFSINNNLASGIIFSVNDISGIPQIDVNADGTIRLAPFAGNIVVAGMTVGMGGGNVSTNTAFGYNALNVNTTGGANTAIGYQALVANTGAGADNTAIGYRALYSNTTGYDNTAVGLSALNLNTTGIDNTAVGVFALRANTASGNSAFGRNALQSNTSGNLNAAFGYYALNANTTGASNTAVGYEAAAQLTTASDTVAIGYRALKNPSTGATSSTAVGSYALAAVTTAADNTAVGRYAGYQLTTGGANSILGAAMYTATTAYYNVAIGHMSLHTLLTGQRNVSVGYQAGYSVTGSYNAIFGAEGASSVTNGSYNTVVGALALPGANGSNNTVIGSYAAQFQADGSTSLTSTSNSVYVGYQTRGFSNSDSNSIVIGYQAIGKGANTTVLGNTSTTQAWIYGTGIIYNSGGNNYSENLRLPESSLGWSVIHMGGAAATSGTGANQWTILKADSASSHRFEIRHSSTAVVSILTNGNVGIGTTSQTSKFQVNNNGATGSAFYVDIGNPSNATTLFEHTGANTPVPFRLTKSGAAGSGSYGLLDLFYDTNTAGHGSNLYFSLDDSAGNITEYGGIGARINANTNGSERGDLYFYTMNTGTGRAEQMVLRYDGNLGIGTTNPAAQLHLAKAGQAQFDMQNTTTGGTPANGAHWRTFVDNVGGGGGNLTYGFYDYRNSRVAMGIDNSGNVGINTTSPAAKLHVSQSTAGAIGLQVSMPTGAETTQAGIRVFGYSPAIELMDKDSIQNWYMGIDDNDSNKLLFGRGYGPGQGVTQAMTIDVSDNVGIGTSAPGSRFQVDTGAAATKGIIVRGFTSQSANLQEWQNSSGNALLRVTSAGDIYRSGGTADLYIGTDNGYGIVYQADNNGHRFQVWSGAWTDRMVILESGNVGIGTSSPSNLMHIVGSNDNSATYYSQLRIDGTGAYPLNITGISLNPNAAVQSHIRFLENGTTKAQLRFNQGNLSTNKLSVYSFTTSTDMFTMDCATGYVGIGTYSPTKSLTIAQNGSAPGVLIYKSPDGTLNASQLTAALGTGSSFTNSGISGGNEYGICQLFHNGTTRVQLYAYDVGVGNSTNFALDAFTFGAVTSFAQVGVVAKSASTPVIVSRGFTSQTAPLMTYQDSSSNVLGYIAANGFDSSTLNDYTWTPNYAGGVNSPSTATYRKSSGNSNVWDGHVYSSEGFDKNVHVTFKVSQTNAYLMVGLNNDPGVDANYSSLDYAWYPRNDGILEIYESNASIGTFGAYTTSTVLSVVYDGTNVIYLKDGTIMRTVARAVGSLLYLDSSFYTLNGAVNSVRYGPTNIDLGSFSARIVSTYNTATGLSTFSVPKTLIGNIHFANGAGSGTSARYQAALTFMGSSSSESQAGIYVTNDNSTGTHMGFATTDSYATGPQLGMTISNTGAISFPRAATINTPATCSIGSTGNNGGVLSLGASYFGLRITSLSGDIINGNVNTVNITPGAGGNTTGLNVTGNMGASGIVAGFTNVGSASSKVMVVKGQTSQSGNLQEWQNSSGTALAVVDASGNISGATLSAGSAGCTTLYTDYWRVRSFTRNAPTTVGNYIEVCNIQEGSGHYEVSVSSEFGAGIGTTTKIYSFCMSYDTFSGFGWYGGGTLTPINMTRQNSYTTSFDFEMELHKVTAYDVRLRLRRTAGTSARYVTITVKQHYLSTADITALSGTGTSSYGGFGQAFYIAPVNYALPVPGASGAGNNIGFYAGSGEGTGAGGSIILQPGAQATTGGDGTVIIRQPGGVAGTDEIQVSHDGTQGTIRCFDGQLRLISADNVRFHRNGDLTNAICAIYSTSGIGGFCAGYTGVIGISAGALPASLSSGLSIMMYSDSLYLSSTGTIKFGPNVHGSSQDVALIRGSVGTVRVSDNSTGGGSLAFTSSSPSAYTTNQNDLVLTGSAFQRLSGTAARDITGVAPPSGGSHVDGRMIRVVNVGAYNLTLKHNSTSSVAANRFYCLGAVDIVIAAGDYAELMYDGTNNGSGAAGWRVY